MASKLLETGATSLTGHFHNDSLFPNIERCASLILFLWDLQLTVTCMSIKCFSKFKGLKIEGLAFVVKTYSQLLE